MPFVESVQRGDTNYTIVGHEHELDGLEDDWDEITAYMEDADAIALETVGYRPGMDEGTTQYESTYSTYTGRLLQEAGDHVDVVYGPDAKHWGPIVGGLMVTALSAGYLAGRNGTDIYEYYMGNENTEELRMDRRDLLSGTAGLLGAYSTGGFDALIPDSIQETHDATSIPVSTTYGDIRDTISAEGLANLDDDHENILSIVGRAHTSSIATYLEDDTVREDKYETYTNIVPDWQLYQTHWEEDGSHWVLKRAAPAHEW